MQKHNDAMKTSAHSSLEKYISHFIWKGSKELQTVLLCERWVGDRTELQHIDPNSYCHNSISFPFSRAAQPRWDMVFIPASSLKLIWGSELQLLNRGTWGSLCWVRVLSTASYLQLTWTSCAPSYIIVLRLLNSTCWHSRLSPWYLRPDAHVIYTGAFPILTARPGSIYNTPCCLPWLSNFFFLFVIIKF